MKTALFCAFALIFFFLGQAYGASMKITSRGIHVINGTVTADDDLGQAVNHTTDPHTSISSLSAQLAQGFAIADLVASGAVVSYEEEGFTCDDECRINSDVDYTFDASSTSLSDWCYTTNQRDCTFIQECNSTGNCEVFPTIRYMLFVSSTTFAGTRGWLRWTASA